MSEASATPKCIGLALSFAPTRKHIVSYATSMGSQTSELLQAFEALPAEEKRAFTAEFLKRAIPFDSGPLEDEETGRASDELFALLDAEENDAPSR